MNQNSEDAGVANFGVSSQMVTGNYRYKRPFYLKAPFLTNEELYDPNNNIVKDGKLHIRAMIEVNVDSSSDCDLMKDLFAQTASEATANSRLTMKTIISASAPHVVLKTSDGCEFRASTEVLSTSSVVFEKMFNTEMIEKSNNAVDIIDFSGKTIEELLTFIYFGTVDSIADVDIELYQAAEVYQIAKLPEICLQSMRLRMNTISDAEEILTFAHHQGIKNFFNECCDRFQQ